ncbi:MAG: 6-carboxytetrahydropterin synthase [Salibacteraceae bacterium]
MSRLVYITRRERFSAAHKLSREDWSDKKNLEVFGKCSNPNWHGHNYELYVTVKGPVSDETGFVIDLKTLGELIRNKVIIHLDHKNINLDTPFMKGKLASTENICIAIWEQLEYDISKLGAVLHCVKLVETENNTVEYYG